MADPLPPPKYKFVAEYKECIALEKELNRWAAKGWELVTVDGSTAYLRRVKKMRI